MSSNESKDIDKMVDENKIENALELEQEITEHSSVDMVITVTNGEHNDDGSNNHSPLEGKIKSNSIDPVHLQMSLQDHDSLDWVGKRDEELGNFKSNKKLLSRSHQGFSHGLASKSMESGTFSRKFSIVSNMSGMEFVVPFQETTVRVGEARAQLKEGVMPDAELVLKKNIKHEVEMTDHLMDMGELKAKFQTSDTEGLGSQQAFDLLEKYGKNCLSPPKTKPWWIKLLLEMATPFAIVLWCAAFLTIIAYAIPSASNSISNLIVGIALILIIIVTGVFSFYQNNKGSSAMGGFRSMMPQATTVIRDGKKRLIDSSDIVPGDLVTINVGDKIPADLRIIHSEHLQVDNSCLTGETEPQTRTVEATHDNPLETSNLAFASTTAVGGSGKGIVIQTGDETMIGKLATLVNSGTEKVKTPMMIEINNFVKLITLFGATLGIVFLIVGLVRKNDWVETVVLCIGIIVANVPEGLPSAIAVSLALAAKRMARKNVLVTDKLNVVETLGRTTVICSDKTGTLTQNIMTTHHVWFEGEIHNAEQLMQDFSGKISLESKTLFDDIYKVCALCSRAEFICDEPQEEENESHEQERKVLGDASETAILRFCDKICNVEQFREMYPKLAEIPFNSTNKYQVSLHSLHNDKLLREEKDSDILLVMKGAPERLLSRCTHIMDNGARVEFSENHSEKFMKDYNILGGKGERVLGMCFAFLPKEEFPLDFEFDTQNVNFPLEGLTFVGAVSMIDPPRPSVPGAIQDCKTASIRVVMVTGDHPVTAESIARSIGIITEDSIDMKKNETNPYDQNRSIIIHGDELKNLTDEELYRYLEMEEIVFARTSPQQKLRIVEGFQHLGHIVAVTGDGVNDSPALKQAHVGVAMGITGTEVSKDASDIILTDDNFGSIVNGIGEGRVIFDNLKKSIAYTLSSKCPETIPFLFSFFLFLPAPLSTILILAIDIGTDLLPAISLAYEGQEASVMKRPPRGESINDKLLTPASLFFSYIFLGLIQSTAGFTSYFILMSHGGNIVPGGSWSMQDLFFNNDFTESQGILLDSNYVEWTYDQRDQLLEKAQTAYFITVLIVRVFCLFTTKTVERSLFKHGLFGNRVLLLGAVEIVVMALIIAYVYPFQFIFGTSSIPYYQWFVGLPYGIAIIAIDELRKLAVRHNIRWLMY